jgi:rhamnogalacturonan endolyase
VDRFLATNAYLDGKKPSMVFQRGYYTRMTLTAYDWNGTTLSQRWAFDNNATYKGQGNHNLSAGDIDGDGFDEIVQGAAAIDHDGKGMYTTGLGHGDAIHFGDLDPDNAGLEVWEVHEDAGVAYGHELHDAKTGKILWGTNYDSDNGRGMSGDIDAASPGHEMWSSAGAGIYSCKGKQLSTAKPSVNFRIYWDGDLQDELLDGTRLDKWTGAGTSRLITLTGTSCNGTKSTPNFSGDILGDWREEVILHDDANLYLHTTTTATNTRLYTLAHDPVYRLAMSWQNAAYNQPPHLGFWLGAGVDKAPKPDIVLVGAPTPPVSVSWPRHSAFRVAGDRLDLEALGLDLGLEVVATAPNGRTQRLTPEGNILDLRSLNSGMWVLDIRDASGSRHRGTLVRP